MFLPENDMFTDIQTAPENYVNKLPVISLSTSTSNTQTNSSTLPNSTSSIASSSSSLPTTPSQLPLRYRNEPAVVGSATGEVRRMRSVLDMKLGAMALPLDAHLALDATFENQTQFHSNEQINQNNLNQNLLPGKRAPVQSIEIQSNVPDKKRLSRASAAALAITSSHQQQQLVDEFGIAIPASTQIKMAREASALNHHLSKDNDPFLHALSSSSLSEASCSVVLAESPSRLDLSALLC